MLPEAVQRERDRKDEEVGDEVHAREHPPAAGQDDPGHYGDVKGDRRAPLPGNAALKLRGVARGFLARSAEVDREERRREVEELVPGLVDLRRQVVPLGVRDRVPELRVMREVPARELERRDSGGNRVENRERGADGRA